MPLDIQERKTEYNKPHCWQYEIRLQNQKEDIEDARRELFYPKDLFTKPLEISREDLHSLSIKDFDLAQEDKAIVFDETREFIERHEWLGKMSLFPTHIFTARYHGYLCGAVVMDMPLVFSKLLGENTRKIERLISRGACISFSPKNLGSALIMFSIRWMVKNTRFRLFTAYSDPEAKELGTIYQACNFYYLGKNSGTNHQYKIESGKWVSGRYFRSRSVYKRLAKKLDIDWLPEWQDGDRIIFDRMPDGLENQLRKESRRYMSSCEKREVLPKHKYAYVLGSTKAETKELRQKLLSRNKIHSYPKRRGE